MTENVNRAFMYGESVFTTMRMVNGVMQDWELHFERLCKGVEFVYGPFTDGNGWQALLKGRLETRFSELEGTKVIRLTLYREQERGFLRPSPISVEELKLHLTSSVFDPAAYAEKKLKLRICPSSMRPYWWPSYLKSGNYFETILYQKMYLKGDDDDLLFVSSEGTVLESSVANIFVVMKNKLFTAPVGPNVLEGVMRKKVLSVSGDFFEGTSETGISREELARADAVFGSNSVRGLFLVDRIDDYAITYKEEFLDKFKKLNDRVLT